MSKSNQSAKYENVKARMWCGVLYIENMDMNKFESRLERLGYPGAYCIHDRDLDDKGKLRKAHMHLMLIFSNTTTGRHVMNIFNEFSADGKRCCSTAEQVYNVRNMYEYLIHNTKDCRKKGKVPYDPSERHEFNNFDIGLYEQVSNEMIEACDLEISEVIRSYRIISFENLDAWIRFMSTKERAYLEAFRRNRWYYCKLCDSVYQTMKRKVSDSRFDQVTQECFEELKAAYGMVEKEKFDLYDMTRKIEGLRCPVCGCSDVKRKGQTQAGTQRYQCKFCKKTFTKLCIHENESGTRENEAEKLDDNWV